MYIHSNSGVRSSFIYVSQNFVDDVKRLVVEAKALCMMLTELASHFYSTNVVHPYFTEAISFP